MPLWAFTALLAMGLIVMEAPLWLRVLRSVPGGPQRSGTRVALVGLLVAELVLACIAFAVYRVAVAHPPLGVSVPLVVADVVLATIVVLPLGLVLVALRQGRRSDRWPTAAS
ncbi:MAG TPA: hypothetical protein VGS80_05695 [Ktedonobacterales bacterium]|jgi:hypothetical protein|nr:hypothetical protein [Ktedonobacterales bacterium]